MRTAIDHVLDDLHDERGLYDYAMADENPPEARLLSAAKIMAVVAVAAEQRKPRPVTVDIDSMRATVGGLSSRRWRSPWWYGDLFCDPARAIPRERPLRDD